MKRTLLRKYPIALLVTLQLASCSHGAGVSDARDASVADADVGETGAVNTKSSLTSDASDDATPPPPGPSSVNTMSEPDAAPTMESDASDHTSTFDFPDADTTTAGPESGMDATPRADAAADSGNPGAPLCDAGSECAAGPKPPKPDGGDAGAPGPMCEALSVPLVATIDPALLDAGGSSLTDTEDAADADAGDGGSAAAPLGCFPSCITELEALCLPSGACSAFAGNGGLNACWQNGLQLSRINSNTESVTTASRLYAGNVDCFTVVFTRSTTDVDRIEWTNNCGNVVATGVETVAGSNVFTIACHDRNATATVDLDSTECSKYVDGAPNFFAACAASPTCPI